MGALGRTARAIGWAALGIVAALGLVLSALALLAALPATRPLVAARAVSFLDEAIAGSLVLGGVAVLPRGGIELHGLEVYDPDGHLVLSVGRARVFVDVTGLRSRAVGLSVELESPSVLLEEEAGGGLSISRAFAPTEGRRERAGGARGRGGGSSGWTFHLSRVTVRGGDLWWKDARGGTRLEASALDLDARGVIGPGRLQADLRLRGALDAPVAAPLALEARGGVVAGALRVPVLRAQLGGTILSAVAEGDVARRAGRVAVTRLEVAREVARAFAPRAPAGDDLDAAAYAESDGAILTAALRAGPSGGGERGRADAAVAARLTSPAAAVGFDAALDRLDPSRLVAFAPPGEVTLAARGAVAGRSLQDLRGRLTASVRRSRLRGGEIGAAELTARADRGTFEVARASASAPGVEASGSFRWREGGEVAGRVSGEARDLGRAVANVGALLGRELPRLGGRARVDATVAGTSVAPAASATVDAPSLEIGAVTLGGARITADLSGSRSAPSLRVEGRISQLRGGGGEVAHDVVVRGAVANDAGTLVATAALPGFRDPASLEARGRLGPGRETLLLSELGFGYPGSRWRLAAPAAVTLAGPSVDRLELANGAQRIAVRGGLVRGRTLDARAELEKVELARIPAGLLPAAHDFRGELTGSVTAVGNPSRPEVDATLSVAGGSVDDLEGLTATASARWSGPQRRLRASAAVARAAGGTADVELDLPLPMAGRPAERVLVRLRGRELPLGDVLATAGSEAPASGTATIDAVLQGTVGAPSLAASAALADGAWGDLERIGLEVTAEDAGEKLTVALRGALEGRKLVSLDAEAPLDLSTLLVRPAAAARGLRAAPLEGSVAVTGLDLAALSGRAGIPAGLAARIDATAALSGSLSAPRARAALDVRGGAWGGYRDLSGRVELVLSDAAVSARGTLALAGDEAVRFEASLRAPVEKLSSASGIRSAPLRVEATVPRIALSRATSSADVPLTGTLTGRISASGTLRTPEATVALAGEGVAIEGRPLGNARVEARYRAARTAGTFELAAAAGGALRGTFAISRDLGAGAPAAPLRDAPAELAATAERLDLGFLPALAPGVIRTAGGTLEADLRASGPLGRLSPRGSLRVAEGRLAVAEWGEWTEIALEASVTDDAFEVRRLEVHRGGGKVTASGSLRGLASTRPAALEAHLASDAFAIARAGMDIARVDLRADATGSFDGTKLAVDVQIPRGLVRLPRRPPRSLQTLEPRKDIVVGKRPERKRRAVAPAAAAAPVRPFTLDVKVRADRNLLVKSDDPRIDLELKADVEYERTGSDDYAQGYVELIRGSIEPIGGRNFVVERGRVQFTGGPPSAAVLDFQARYDNPAAVVTVNVDGPARSPEIHFHSVPQMDDAQIAMLIATGRADIKAGGGGVSTLTGEEAGKAALGVLATQAFKSLVADKLPVDTVAIDSSGFTAGRYLTDKIYVIYQRRFDADTLKGENTDEVRVEYQISPRWMFESRYGNAQSGGANLIWSREY